MKKIYNNILLILLVILFTADSAAQLSAPRVEAVYGGRILGMDSHNISADTSIVYISAESANSVFYAYVTALTSATPVFHSFSVMPGLGSDDNYGAGIQQIKVHRNSGKLFFLHQGIKSASYASSTVNNVVSTNASCFTIVDDYLFYWNADSLHYGVLNSSGSFTYGGKILTGSVPVSHILFNPSNFKIYLFGRGGSPVLYKSSDVYNSLGSGSTFSAVSLSSLPAAEWLSAGIAPDGRIFIGGHNNNDKRISYSDDEITWNSFAPGITGVSGYNFDFGGNSSAYHVYWSSVYSDNKGVSGSWEIFGMVGGMETHPNDGNVLVDPGNSFVVYMTTDQGIGASYDRGVTIFEIDNGVEAVQVEDFDMTPDKSTAWLASKSGIRKVSDYTTSPSWTNAIFPNHDGSPYYSIAMKHGDTNTVYAGNLRVYRTSNGGATWNNLFSTENAPYNWSGIGQRIEALEVAPFDNNIVFAGYYVDGADDGGLFNTSDGGITWSQILLHSSSAGHDADIFDIVFNIEGGDTVAYAGVYYNPASPSAYSVYRIVKSGSIWSASQDMTSTNTSTGTVIVATIRDLYISSTGDTVYACGTDAGTNHPVVYYKPLNTTNLWTPMPVSGFPFVSGKQGYAIALGIDTLYCAVDNEIYYFPLSGSGWSNGYVYPNGTRINFLYFDELLAGTSLGLYGHYGTGPTAVHESGGEAVMNYSLEQNYPNPFNPETVIGFTINRSSHVRLSVYNMAGESVSELVNEDLSAGDYSIRFNGAELPSGVYFYKLTTETGLITRKMLLIK